MVCVKSTSFSLCLNGSTFGYFKGQRGLRQGDPISPLIFTLCMDYLTRMINYATEKWPFQYHPLCKGLKLNHLMFADDLLMFCKGNAQSIMLLIRAFSSFSKASGLTMNSTKSEVYFNGMSSSLKADIMQATGFVEGTLPFRYLGVPIQAGRSNRKD
ncbi:putative mitochondrial protein AtMg01250 [Silene latifolia]|uniref:putative mitochondrial protein AtMg01250 n=1 Tax=Silene latifolia TaxID=37657 RepID=UPI003D78951D